MFIRNAWYIAAWSDEVADKPLARRICDQPVVLFRGADGQVGAVEDRCIHRAAPLHFGRVVEAGLECGYHGLVFDRGGRCVRIPSQTQIPDNARIKGYPVVEKNKFIWIWMGEAAKADVGQIIDYPFHDDPKKWPSKGTVIPVKANYMLLIDNLMDPSHVGYVHRNTIGGNPGQHVSAKVKVTKTARGVNITRWLLNSTPPDTYVKAVGFKGPIDRWMEFQYVAPGVVMLWTGALDAGTGAYDQGRREGGFSLRNFNGLTPETATSCHYFWSVANGYRQDDPRATEQVFKEVGATFLEDKVIVEGQQERLTESGEGDLIDISTDGARLQMRRTVDRLLAAERAAAE